MKKVYRFIIPCGLGAFCIEQFNYGENLEKTFNVVYDCGSLSNPSSEIIDQAIKEHLSSGVDLLFISHFHEDHINLIYKLPLKENTVVVIPFITAPCIGLYDSFTNSDSQRFIDFLDQKHLKTIKVKPQNDNTSKLEFKSIQDIPLELTNTGIIIEDINWSFLPFHLQDLEAYNAIVCEFEKLGVDIFKEDWSLESNKDRIKTIYKNLVKKNLIKPSDFNCTTMLLKSSSKEMTSFSITYKGEYIERNIIKDDLITYSGSVDATCIYTGDIPLKNRHFSNDLDRFLSFLQSKVSLFQIPHHGSSNNFSADVFKRINPYCAFVNGTNIRRSGYPFIGDIIIESCKQSAIPLFRVMDENKKLIQTIEEPQTNALASSSFQ